MNLKPIARRFSPNHFSFKHVTADAILLFASLYASLWLRLGEERLHEHIEVLNRLAIAFVVIRILVFLGAGVYQVLWRYISTHDATRIASANLLTVPVY